MPTIAYPSIGNYANLNNWMPEGTRGFVVFASNSTVPPTTAGPISPMMMHWTQQRFTPLATTTRPDAASVTPVRPDLAITEIDYDADANTVTLTWRKTEALRPTLAKYSFDMTDWGGDLDDGSPPTSTRTPKMKTISR